MGFFDFFKMPDINQEIHAYKETKGAIFREVRMFLCSLFKIFLP